MPERAEELLAELYKKEEEAIERETREVRLSGGAFYCLVNHCGRVHLAPEDTDLIANLVVERLKGV